MKSTDCFNKKNVTIFLKGLIAAAAIQPRKNNCKQRNKKLNKPHTN